MKRIFSLILAVVLIVTICNTGVFGINSAALTAGATVSVQNTAACVGKEIQITVNFSTADGGPIYKDIPDVW